MVRNKAIILLTSVLCIISADIFCQSSWEIDKDKDGIKVFTRVEKGSDFKSFKAVMIVNSPISEIVKILRDVNEYTKWFGYTKTSKLIKQETDDVQYNYVETIFPWPYANRDMVYRMSVDTFVDGSVKIIIKGIPDYLPEKEGLVRMKKAEGYILLKPLDNLDDKIEAIYIFHSEPGYNVPSWLANRSIAELPFKTFSGLRNTLKEKSKNFGDNSW